MKKMYFLMAAGILALGACTGNRNSRAEVVAEAEKAVADSLPDVTTGVYEGILPAADADGVRYTLNVASKGGDRGVYELTEVTLPERKGGVSQSKGEYTVRTGMPGDAGGRYMELVPERKRGEGVDTLYFALDGDTAVTLVGRGLERSAGPLNYTLQKL